MAETNTFNHELESGLNESSNGNKEEKFYQFMGDMALPRKSYLRTLPGITTDISDIVNQREDPVSSMRLVNDVLNLHLNAVRYKPNELDMFWLTEHVINIAAFDRLDAFHKHHGRSDYKPHYGDFLSGKLLMYRLIVDDIIKNVTDLDGRVIEVGGGSGISLLMLLKEMGYQNKALDVTDLDISRAALDYFLYLSQNGGFFNSNEYETFRNRIHAAQGDFYQTYLPSDNFKLAFSVGVDEHLNPEQQSALLQERIRITKPGGVVMVSVPNAKSQNYKLMKAKEEQFVAEERRFPMVDYSDVDPVELLKNAGLNPFEDGTYRQGYTLIAPPNRLPRGVIDPQDIDFFEGLRFRLPYNPPGFQTRDLLNAWYALEKGAPPRILERYGMFTHAFGKKP